MTDLLDGYLDRSTLAEQLRTSTRTIARYENQPDGLPSLRIGGRKFYRIEAVVAWLTKRERRPNPRKAA